MLKLYCLSNIGEVVVKASDDVCLATQRYGDAFG